MNRRQLPNLVTALRGALALPLLWLILEQHYLAALAVLLLAGASDALDGYLAKRNGWQSRLGAVLDPIADKLLLTVAIFALWKVAAMPVDLLLLMLVRDVLLGLGSLAWWWRFGPFTPVPSRFGKFATFAQVLLVAGLLLHLSGFALPLDLRIGLIGAAAVFTAVSGVDYLVRYSLRAWRGQGSDA